MIDLAKTLEIRDAQVGELQRSLAFIRQALSIDDSADIIEAIDALANRASHADEAASAQLVGRDVWLTTVPRGAEESHNFRSEATVLGVDASGVLVTFITWSPWVRDTFTGRYDEEDGSEIWTTKPRTRSQRGRGYYPWSQVQSIEDREVAP